MMAETEIVAFYRLSSSNCSTLSTLENDKIMKSIVNEMFIVSQHQMCMEIFFIAQKQRKTEFVTKFQYFSRTILNVPPAKLSSN